MQLGPYQLLRQIGSGGMAEVWSARRPASMAGADKFVAIKLLAPHLSNKPEYREMFLAEARLSMLLNHSNIVQVFDAVDDPPHCYMVMELIEGMTLAQLERGLGKQLERIPLDVAAYVIGELLRALAYAHAVTLEAGTTIVHRDVSPQNVMVTTSGEVKLMDFGIARFASEDTQANFVKGKLQYMPPEQLRKQTRKPTIDLFAVGGILHELIDGRRFRGRIEETRLLGMVLEGEVPPLREGSEVPREIDELRLGLLAADEQARVQSAKDALALLYAWPGYRVASIELEELVQRFVAPSSSMSGPVGYFDNEDSGVMRFDSATASSSGARGRSEEPEPSSNSDLRKIDPPAAADTVESSAEPGDDEPVAKPPAWQTWGLKLGAPLLFTVFGMVLMLIVVKSMNADEAASEPVAGAAASEPPAKPEPKPELDEQPASEPTPTPKPEPAPIPDPLLAPAPTPAEPIGADDQADPSAPGPDAPKASETVPVEFVANDYFFLYVKVAGKLLTLEPRARTKLPVGKHVVFLRTDREGKWIKAGRIDVEADHAYRVEMLEPAGLEQAEVAP
ncbi:serine/threonine-protein kinase [Nannocystaceae bacterium ST9]